MRWRSFRRALLSVMLLFFSSGAAWGASDANMAWLSLLLGNQQIAKSAIKDGVILIDDKKISEVDGVSADASNNTLIQLSGALANQFQDGSLLFIPPGIDDRFPLGITGRVVAVTSNPDGSKTFELEQVAFADIMKESTYDLKDIVLDSSNFVGVIAPAGIQASSKAVTVVKAARTAKNVSGGDYYSFRNGAIVVSPSSGTIVSPRTTVNAGTVSLNMKVDIADMGDGISASTMNPVDADTSVGFVISGALDNIRLTESHDFSKTKGLDSLDLRLDGDFNFDVKFNGKGSLTLGYFSQAWKEVESMETSVLGMSGKLTGLSSDDKHGKYPLAGLVWQIPANTIITTSVGQTQTPVRLAKSMGVIVWFYLDLKGEFTWRANLDWPDYIPLLYPSASENHLAEILS